MHFVNFIMKPNLNKEGKRPVLINKPLLIDSRSVRGMMSVNEKLYIVLHCQRCLLGVRILVKLQIRFKSTSKIGPDEFICACASNFPFMFATLYLKRDRIIIFQLH